MKNTKSSRKEELDTYGMWVKSLNFQGTICEMFPIWIPVFDYAENTMNIKDLQIFMKILRSLLIKVDADNFDFDPLFYSLIHYRKDEEFQFLVKTRVPFNEDRKLLSTYNAYSILTNRHFSLSYHLQSILPRRLELLIENWNHRKIHLVSNRFFEESSTCIKDAFGNDHSPYEVLKILIDNAKKMGIDPNPRLGQNAEGFFIIAHDKFKVTTLGLDPDECRKWSFLRFVKRVKLKGIVAIYKNSKNFK